MFINKAILVGRLGRDPEIRYPLSRTELIRYLELYSNYRRARITFNSYGIKETYYKFSTLLKLNFLLFERVEIFINSFHQLLKRLYWRSLIRSPTI